MKNQFKKINILFIAIFIAGCSKKEDNPVPAQNSSICTTTSSEFQSIFGVAGGTITYDFDVHSYDFKLTQNKTICKIGYQSTTYNAGNPYRIKIIQGGTVIYNQPHIFSSTSISYVTPTTPVNLNAGVTCTIERWQTNSGPFNSDNIGRVKDVFVAYPFGSSFMSILGSKFYFDSTYTNPILGMPNGTSTLTNTKVPYIDIIFQ